MTIDLFTTRQYAEACRDQFYPTINLYKITRLRNTAQKSLNSEEYMSSIVINCLLEEIEMLIQKKLLNTKSQKIKFQFTPAQAVVFYRALLALPIPGNQFYLQKIRNDWVQELDQELTFYNVCQVEELKSEARNKSLYEEF